MQNGFCQTATGVKAQPETGSRDQLRVLASQSNLQATITIERPSANSAVCNLIVAVHIAGRDWPQLAGIGVTLRHGEQILSVDETNAFGEIIFRQVPVADLPSLEVMGFRQFSLRGKQAAFSEWWLVCMAFNLKRLHTLLQG